MNQFIDELKVFSGTAHPELTQAICDYLDIPVGQSEAFKFANDNTFVRILENIRQRDVFLVQPTCAPTNDNLMELLIMIDACKRASAGRITAVVPYYGYGRTDKKDQPRVPITGRLVADLLTAAGADRMLTVDLHAGQIQGFFNIPVDELTAIPILTAYFREKEISNLVVVAVGHRHQQAGPGRGRGPECSPGHHREAAVGERRPHRDPERDWRCQGHGGADLRRRNPHRGNGD